MMAWLTVTTLPDGTIVEVPMPTSDGTGDNAKYCYRVRRGDVVLEFANLAEVADSLLELRAEERHEGSGINLP